MEITKNNASGCCQNPNISSISFLGAFRFFFFGMAGFSLVGCLDSLLEILRSGIADAVKSA